MIASTFLLASWLGCIIIAAFGMLLGRRTWIIVGNVIQIVGTIISASSFSFGQLIAGRVFIVSHGALGCMSECSELTRSHRALAMAF